MRHRTANVLAALLAVSAVAVELLVLALTGWGPGENGGAPPVVEMAPAVLGFGLVGAMLLHRRPEHRVGWVIAAVGAANALSSGSVAYATWALPGAESPDLPVALELIGSTLQEFSIVLALVVLPVIFPTGSVSGRRWRWLPWTALIVGSVGEVAVLLVADTRTIDGAAYPSPFGIASITPALELVAGVTFAAVLLLVIPAVVSLVLRFRHATGVVRLQLRWFVFAMLTLALTLLTLLAWNGLALLGVLPALGELPFDLLMLVPLTAIPVSIGAAVMRYGLYEVDRLVSRTVSYTAVTLILAGLYALVVLAAQGLLGSGRDVPDVVVASATLVVAALFRPIRGRVQAAVDHRFSRRRYDAVLTVSAFAVRLRDQVHVQPVVDELGEVVAQTLAPTTMSLWAPPLRGPAR